MRVLVTGGTGFIGRFAVAALEAEGHEAVIASRRPQPGRGAIVADLVAADDASLAAIRDSGAEAMLALAWETEHGAFWHATSNAAWCASMIRIAEAFLDGGGRRIVCAGTCVEYDPPAEGPCIPGETPVKPAFPYSVSKNAFHDMLAWMTQARGASYAWGRIFLAYGPHEQERRLVPSIIGAILEGRLAECSSGRQIRDFLHAEDYGRSFAALTTSDYNGPLNVCSGQPVAIAEVAEMIGSLMGRPDLVALGALPDRPNEPRNLWGDASALHDGLGVRPKFTLEQGLRNVIDWRVARRSRQ